MHKRTLTFLALLLCGTAALPAAAQSPWSLSGGIGLGRESDALDGPALGGLGARARIMRETLIGFGVEVSAQSLGESAAVGRCVDPSCSRMEYVGSSESTTYDVAAAFRLGGRPTSSLPYVLATLGYVSLHWRRELPDLPAGNQQYTGLAASVGLGYLPFRIGPTAQLGLEARAHGVAVGDGESGGVGGYYTVTGVVRFGFGGN